MITIVIQGKIEKEIAGMSNYTLVGAAVSDYNGRAIFNVSGKGDWGCSSLLPFSENVKTAWVGRTDMVVTETIEVDVIRLDTFIRENNISHIDYLHIDAQGSDLKVLQGMGEYIKIVKQGVLEAAAKPDVLYLGQNSANASVDFLHDNGFEITKVEYNDPGANEVNIYFRSRDNTEIYIIED
jgi:FkbM family methyltransferase